MRIFKNLRQYSSLRYGKPSVSTIDRVFPFRVWPKQMLSTNSEDPELNDFMEYLDLLKNYEKLGVPKGAGTDSDDGFDLGRMKRLMERLGNPLSKFKAIHIAGTKGKGSTAAFLANILRAEGYNVGSYTSPHIQTIRERISIGRSGEMVSAKTLNCIFNQNKKILDQSMELENGRLSHFEVLTAMAFALFAQENVDIAVVEAGLGGARDATNVICSSGLAVSVITSIGEEHLTALGGSLESIAAAKAGIIKRDCPLVLGGPFLPHVEFILRNKASSMCSPVMSASDAGSKCSIKSISMTGGKLFQTCDIVIQTERSFQLFFELLDVKLRMVGSHQLQNAVTATCAALCLRNLGWKLSDGSIRTGLEETFLIGRSQILSCEEVAALGLHGAKILLDGAHTKESAKALVNTINMAFPDTHLVLVIAMASDKDHIGFAKECLLGGNLEAVILTEVDIAGGKSRTTKASSLKEHWIQASQHLGFTILSYDGITPMKVPHFSIIKSKQNIILATETSSLNSMKMARQILSERLGDRPGIITVTGSLHIVSSVLASLPSC